MCCADHSPQETLPYPCVCVFPFRVLACKYSKKGRFKLENKANILFCIFDLGHDIAIGIDSIYNSKYYTTHC